jgi:hypothetical protein
VTARDEVLAAARKLSVRTTDGTFSVDDIVTELHRRGSAYAESTIRTHVVSRMCANAPDNHAVTYDDLVRTETGRYRLA